jgi:DNA polymerase-3 subunit gamma/tau
MPGEREARLAPVSESTSLYRRHRPQSFDEVVGQEHVVRTLSGAVESDKVHHAYLFVGSRGTGKTSMAKILARSLNCVNGPTLTPCGECESCVTIAAGTSLDVIEMDAASNRSVDDIRELRDRVGYAPAAGHWKVYILDEAHMLTKEAWNAFLKTLEEPPPNTAFVLATTEPQKVMASIVDRCQRFDFHRPSLEQISEVVRRAAAAEGFDVEDGAVALISRSASGSFRDALGTLDQLVAYGGDKVATEDVLAILGSADAELIFKTIDAVGSGDAKGALAAVDELVRSGRDPATFARDLIGHLRQLIVIRTTGEMPDSFSVTISEPERLREQAAQVPEASVMAALDSLSAAIAAIREGDDARLSVEVALLKVARPSLDSSREALLRRIERLEGGGGEGSAGASVDPTAPTRVADEGSGREQGGQGAPEPTAAPAEPPQPPADEDHGSPEETAAATTATEVKSTVDLDKVMSLWPAVVDHVRESGSEMLSTVFEGARPLAVDAEKSVLKVGFPASATFNKRKAEARANVERFTESLRAILGQGLRPVYELLDGDPDAEAAKPPTVSDDELIELIKTKFDASEVVDDEQRSAEG